MAKTIISLFWPVAQGIPDRSTIQWPKSSSHCLRPVAQGIPNRRFCHWPKNHLICFGQWRREFLIGDSATGQNNSSQLFGQWRREFLIGEPASGQKNITLFWPVVQGIPNRRFCHLPKQFTKRFTANGRGQAGGIGMRGQACGGRNVRIGIHPRPG